MSPYDQYPTEYDDTPTQPQLPRARQPVRPAPAFPPAERRQPRTEPYPFTAPLDEARIEAMSILANRMLGLPTYQDDAQPIGYGIHQEFSGAADEDPQSLHLSGMYADALRDEGRHAHAAMVDANAQGYQDNGVFGMHGGGPPLEEGQSFVRISPHGYDSWSGEMPYAYTVQLHINTGHGPHASRSFAATNLDPDVAHELVQHLESEGAIHASGDWGHDLLQSHVGAGEYHGEKYARTGVQPTEYGPAEDEAAFVHSINQEPLDTTTHGAFADWLRDQDRESDAAFRDAVRGSISRRLADWTPPTFVHRRLPMGLTEPTGRMEYPELEEHALARGTGDQVRRITYVPWKVQGQGPGDMNPGPWIWGTGDAQMVSPNDPALFDPAGNAYPFWQDWHTARRTGAVPWWTPAEQLDPTMTELMSPAEQWAGGVTNPGNLDPALWPQVEALMRDRHARGLKFSAYAAEGEMTPYDFGDTDVTESYADHLGHTAYADPLDPNEQAAFEAAIDANPLDALTHGAYADWLQDRGHDDEAAFRRAMEGWVRGTPGLGSPPSPVSSANWWAGGRMGYPAGVELANMDFPRQQGYPDSPRISSNGPDHFPVAHRNRDEGDNPGGYAHIGFRNYRGMEEAFRRAFLQGRQQPQEPPTQAARYERTDYTGPQYQTPRAGGSPALLDDDGRRLKSVWWVHERPDLVGNPIYDLNVHHVLDTGTGHVWSPKFKHARSFNAPDEAEAESKRVDQRRGAADVPLFHTTTDVSNSPLSPAHLWMLGLPGGEAPHAALPDALHSDGDEHAPMLPEDFYAMSRYADYDCGTCLEDLMCQMAELAPYFRAEGQFDCAPDAVSLAPTDYGLAPADDLRAFAFGQSQSGGMFNSGNLNDQIFADNLADHGDPRELLVRRDLSYRHTDENPRPWADSFNSHLQELLGLREDENTRDYQDQTQEDPDTLPCRITHIHELPDSKLTLYPYTGPTGARAWHASWVVPGEDSKGMWDAALSDAELRQMASELGVDPEKPGAQYSAYERTDYADEEDFHRAIRQSPHDLTNHLVFADWLAEQNRPDDERFRRDLAGVLKTRLETPWEAPTREFGTMLDPPPGFTRVPEQDVRPAPAAMPLNSVSMRPTYTSSLAWNAPAGWQWGNYMNKHRMPGVENLPALHEWAAGRDNNLYLTLSELHAFDINRDVPDPDDWPSVEAALRAHWNQKQNFARYEDGTDYEADVMNYADPGMPGIFGDHPEGLELWSQTLNNPHDVTGHLVLADWLAERGYYKEEQRRREFAARMAAENEARQQPQQNPPALGEIGPGGPIGPVEFNQRSNYADEQYHPGFWDYRIHSGTARSHQGAPGFATGASDAQIVGSPQQSRSSILGPSSAIWHGVDYPQPWDEEYRDNLPDNTIHVPAEPVYFPDFDPEQPLPPGTMEPNWYARTPTDDYGHLSSVMQPIPEDSFLHGRFGPHPAPAAYGRTDYADQSTIDDMIRQLHEEPQLSAHRWGLDDPLSGHRGVLADALDESGRSEEAQLLREQGRHLIVSPEGNIEPGRFTTDHIMQAFDPLAMHLMDRSRGNYPEDDIEVRSDETPVSLPTWQTLHTPFVPLEPGQVRVLHTAAVPLTHTNLHHSELGSYLADYLDDMYRRHDPAGPLPDTNSVRDAPFEEPDRPGPVPSAYGQSGEPVGPLGGPEAPVGYPIEHQVQYAPAKPRPTGRPAPQKPKHFLTPPTGSLPLPAVQPLGPTGLLGPGLIPPPDRMPDETQQRVRAEIEHRRAAVQGQGQGRPQPGRMSRYAPEEYARTPRGPAPTYSDLVTHAAAVIDNPLEDARVMALADHLNETHPDNPAVQAFIRWTTGEGTFRDIMPHTRSSAYKPYGPFSDRTDTIGIDDPDIEFRKETDENLPAYARGQGESFWHQRAKTGRGSHRTENAVVRLPTARIRGRRLTTPEVVHALYTEGGPESLINAVIGARYFHPDREGDKSGAADTVRMSRYGLTEYAPHPPFDPGTPLRPEGFLETTETYEPGFWAARHQVHGRYPWTDRDLRERQAFEQIIGADPTDVVARSVYADWLRERGEDELAEQVIPPNQEVPPAPPEPRGRLTPEEAMQIWADTGRAPDEADYCNYEDPDEEYWGPAEALAERNAFTEYDDSAGHPENQEWYVPQFGGNQVNNPPWFWQTRATPSGGRSWIGPGGAPAFRHGPTSAPIYGTPGGERRWQESMGQDPAVIDPREALRPGGKPPHDLAQLWDETMRLPSVNWFDQADPDEDLTNEYARYAYSDSYYLHSDYANRPAGPGLVGGENDPDEADYCNYEDPDEEYWGPAEALAERNAFTEYGVGDWINRHWNTVRDQFRDFGQELSDTWDVAKNAYRTVVGEPGRGLEPDVPTPPPVPSRPTPPPLPKRPTPPPVPSRPTPPPLPPGYGPRINVTKPSHPRAPLGTNPEYTGSAHTPWATPDDKLAWADEYARYAYSDSYYLHSDYANRPAGPGLVGGENDPDDLRPAHRDEFGYHVGDEDSPATPGSPAWQAKQREYLTTVSGMNKGRQQATAQPTANRPAGQGYFPEARRDATGSTSVPKQDTTLEEFVKRSHDEHEAAADQHPYYTNPQYKEVFDQLTEDAIKKGRIGTFVSPGYVPAPAATKDEVAGSFDSHKMGLYRRLLAQRGYELGAGEYGGHDKGGNPTTVGFPLVPRKGNKYSEDQSSVRYAYSDPSGFPVFGPGGQPPVPVSQLHSSPSDVFPPNRGPMPGHEYSAYETDFGTVPNFNVPDFEHYLTNLSDERDCARQDYAADFDDRIGSWWGDDIDRFVYRPHGHTPHSSGHFDRTHGRHNSAFHHKYPGDYPDPGADADDQRGQDYSMYAAQYAYRKPPIPPEWHEWMHVDTMPGDAWWLEDPQLTADELAAQHAADLANHNQINEHYAWHG